MKFIVVHKETAKPAFAKVCDSVTLSTVNGGWISARCDRSIHPHIEGFSAPISQIQAIYRTEPGEK